MTPEEVIEIARQRYSVIPESAEADKVEFAPWEWNIYARLGKKVLLVAVVFANNNVQGRSGLKQFI